MKKIICVLLSLMCSGCVLVVEEDTTRNERRGDTYYYDDCEDQEPYSYAPEYCEIYSEEECCEWYVGYDCYETWCYDYYYCEWYYYDMECY